jgi:hypothetical protein
MPEACPSNTDQTMDAILQAGAASGRAA